MIFLLKVSQKKEKVESWLRVPTIFWKKKALLFLRLSMTCLNSKFLDSIGSLETLFSDFLWWDWFTKFCWNKILLRQKCFCWIFSIFFPDWKTFIWESIFCKFFFSRNFLRNFWRTFLVLLLCLQIILSTQLITKMLLLVLERRS